MYTRKKESEFLTEDEARLICSLPDQRTAEGKRDMAILTLMLTTGCRKAEVCDLTVGSIKDYRNQKILEVIGKGNKLRRIALKPDTCELIMKYHRAIGNGHDPSQPLFLTLGKHFKAYVCHDLTFKRSGFKDCPRSHGSFRNKHD